MDAFEKDRQQKTDDPEGLLALYEAGFRKIQRILDDDRLTRGEMLDEIADIVFGDEEEMDSP